MNVLVWAREASRERARRPTATTSPRARRRSSRECDVVSLHMRLVDATRGIVTAADLGAHEADGAAGQHQPRRR